MKQAIRITYEQEKQERGKRTLYTQPHRPHILVSHTQQGPCLLLWPVISRRVLQPLSSLPGRFPPALSSGLCCSLDSVFNLTDILTLRLSPPCLLLPYLWPQVWILYGSLSSELLPPSWFLRKTSLSFLFSQRPPLPHTFPS